MSVDRDNGWSLYSVIALVVATGVLSGLVSWGGQEADVANNKKEIAATKMEVAGLKKRQERIVRHMDYQTRVMQQVAEKLGVNPGPAPPPIE